MKRYFFAAVLIIISAISLFCQDDLSKAKELINEKKYSESKSIVKKIIEKNGKIAEAHYLLSKLYYVEKNIDDAEEEAETAVDINGNVAEYHYWLGACYGRDAQSASIFRQPFLASKTKNEFLKAIQLDPNHANARAALAQYYLMAPGIMGGDINKAIEQAKILTRLDEVRGKSLLIQIFTKQNNFKDAENEFISLEKKIGNDKKYFTFYNSYGYFLLSRGRVDEAIQKFKRQIELAPENANAHDSFGEALLKKGMLHESLAEYNKALQLDPDLKNSKDKVEEIKKLIAEKGGR